MKKWFSAALALLILLTGLGIAYAQDTTVDVPGVYKILEPYLLTVVSVVVSAIVAWLANTLRLKWGVDIEIGYREALQTSLNNAAGILIQRLGTKAGTLARLDVKNKDVADAINYVIHEGAPDAVKRFGITPEDIALKLEAKLGLLTGMASTDGTTTSIPVSKPV